MLKLSVFGNDNKAYAEWCLREARLLEENGLARETESLRKAKAGETREAWLRMSNISAENADREWARQIEWLEGQVKHLKRKINKYRKEAEKSAGNEIK